MLPGCVQRLYQQLSPPVPGSQLHEVGLCSWPCPLSAEQRAQQEAGRAGSTPKGCHPVPILLLPRYSLFPSGISPSGSANTENDAAETHPGHPQHHNPSYSVFWTHQPTPRQQVSPRSPLPEGLLPKPPPQLLLYPLASCWHTKTQRNSGQQQQHCTGTPARESLSPASARRAAAGLIIPLSTHRVTRGLLSAHQGWDSAAPSAIPRALPSYVIPCLSGFDFLFPFQYFMSFCSLLPSPGKPVLPGGAASLQQRQPHEPHVPPEAVQKQLGSPAALRRAGSSSSRRLGAPRSP